MRNKTIENNEENVIFDINTFVFGFVTCSFLICLGDSLHWKTLQLAGLIEMFTVSLFSIAVKKSKGALTSNGFGEIRS